MQQTMPYGSLAQMTGINPYQHVQSLFGGTPGNFAPTAGTEVFGPYGANAGLSGFGDTTAGWGSTLSSMLPIFGGGLAGWGIGRTMAGLTGGNVTGSNWGGLAGGAGGAWLGTASGIGAGVAWGSVVPIVGTIFGAILGGLLGGLFGGGRA